MPKTPIDAWLDRVCAHLRPGRRRDAVRRELAAHLDDRLRLLHTQGIDGDEAAQRAVRAMGDPDELGRSLAELYSPLRRFVGWLPTVLLWVAAAAVALCLLLHLFG